LEYPALQVLIPTHWGVEKMGKLCFRLRKYLKSHENGPFPKYSGSTYRRDPLNAWASVMGAN
jgi:hypothetical protein